MPCLTARTAFRSSRPLVLPRRTPVLCVMHHVHSAQFGVHFPPWLAGIGRLLEGPAARLAYRGQGCVAVSLSTIEAMRARLRWPGPVYLIPNGTPVLNGTPGAVPAGGEQRPRLAWIGRLVAHKRAELLVPVAARGFTIDVVGRGPGAVALSAAITAAEQSGQLLASAIALHGYLPEADKNAVLAGALLHLNTSQGEGWGLCVLEAAALGIPTVAYDVEGLRDSVLDGQTGWLVREGEELADVVERAARGARGPGAPRRGGRRLPRLGGPAELGTEHHADGHAARRLRAAGNLADGAPRNLDRGCGRRRHRRRGTGPRRGARVWRRARATRHGG